MVKKRTKQTGTPKRVFRNSEDVFQFEKERYEREHQSLLPKGAKVIKTAPTKYKYELDAFYCNPKNNEIMHVDPNDEEQVEHVKSLGYVPAKVQLETSKNEWVDNLTDNPEMYYRQEIEPIIFNSKGKTSPSVPFLRVYVDSSIGEIKDAIHLMHTKTKMQKNSAKIGHISIVKE